MASMSFDKKAHSILILWIAVGWAGFLLMPWYGIEDFWLFGWVRDGYPNASDYAPAAFLIAGGNKLWLTPLILPLVCAIFALRLPKTNPLYSSIFEEFYSCPHLRRACRPARPSWKSAQVSSGSSISSIFGVTKKR